MSDTTTERAPFSLTTSEREGCRIFHLMGRLMDQPQADDLMEALDKQLGDHKNLNVVLDMSQLLYMNSTGLNIMISVLTRTRNAGGEVALAALSHSVKQLFVVTKLDTIFKIGATVDEAIARFSA